MNDHIGNRAQPSRTKKTLIMILKQQLKDIHNNIVAMQQPALITNVSKNKVLYKLTNKQNILQLLYSYIALTDYYISKQYYANAIKLLQQAQDIAMDLTTQKSSSVKQQIQKNKQKYNKNDEIFSKYHIKAINQQVNNYMCRVDVADILYLKAKALYQNSNISNQNNKKIQQITQLLQKCIDIQNKNMIWIQPNLRERQTNMLESINILQKIQFYKLVKHPQHRQHVKEKLIKLSYDKIKIIKHFNQQNSQNYYFGLAMSDLAEIHYKFTQYIQASQKIKTAIKMLTGHTLTTNQQKKLIQFYFISAQIYEKLGKNIQCALQLRNAIDLIQQGEKKKDQNNLDKMGNFSIAAQQENKVTKLQQKIYYMYIKKTLNF